VDDAPPPAPPTAALLHKYTFGDYAFQLITVTAGVLIALLINGLVEWNGNRRLVSEARATIAQEVADNKKDLDGVLAGNAKRHADLEAALLLANQLLQTRTTTVQSMNLSFNIADLRSTGWRSAERTGAVSHMPYAEVQRYSGVYELQELYAAQQRKAREQLGAATAILSSDFVPEKADPREIESFRQQLRVMQASLRIEEQLGKRLSESYAALLEGGL
jgi:hypothetical protein